MVSAASLLDVYAVSLLDVYSSLHMTELAVRCLCLGVAPCAQAWLTHALYLTKWILTKDE